ncbi:MAG: hypothetical protein K8S54_06550 [Spirochaetia bacterium]|nr:hypothetical protein [Spirochaetia bacterium]
MQIIKRGRDMSENVSEIERPAGALDVESVTKLCSRFSGQAIDCAAWLPVYHEGVRMLIDRLLAMERPVILFNLPEPLALQLSLCGVAINDQSAIVGRMDASEFVAACGFCASPVRFRGDGEYRCPHCKNRLTVKKGIIS